MIKFIKNDFRSVRGACKCMTNNKMPDWAIVIYYILLAPIGYALYPFVKMHINKKLKKLDEMDKSWLEAK
jgi:hypothetical protein